MIKLRRFGKVSKLYWDEEKVTDGEL